MPRVRRKTVIMAAVLMAGATTGLLSLSPATLHRVYAQTVPTITPTPEERPTSPPAPTRRATTPSQQPTATQLPVVRPTATRATTTGTSGGQATPTALLSTTEAAWPTAEPCDDEPTVWVLDGGAWIYEGPGEDYDRLGRLDEGTVRPVLARAAYGAWWLIALEEDEVGWIADADVDVQGDTSELPLEEAPELPDGETPTPGPTWEPTPQRDCITPTVTPTPTETPTSSPTPVATSTATATATPESAQASATPDLVVTEEVEPLPAEEEGSSLMWLPVAGLVLLAAGAFLYVTRRS